VKKSYAYLAALAILGAAPPASVSAEGSAASLPQFGTVDKDRDGLISRSEAQAFDEANSRFDQLDSDRNGQISLSEWQAVSPGAGAAGVSAASRFEAASDIPVMIP
jgi:hypothetical protein